MPRWRAISSLSHAAAAYYTCAARGSAYKRRRFIIEIIDELPMIVPGCIERFLFCFRERERGMGASP
jgi:hypothetical protein